MAAAAKAKAPEAKDKKRKRRRSRGPRLIQVRLDKLNIPAETLRQGSAPREARKLEASIERHGVLVPMLVRPLGQGEYDVWDGVRRTTAMRALGLAGTTKVPAVVVRGGDPKGVVYQVAVNQVRERLSAFAEAEAFRQLIDDHQWSAKDAAAALGKSKGWGGNVTAVFKLPARMLRGVRTGRFSMGHARVLARVRDNRELLDLLHGEALTGNVSARKLSVLARRAGTDSLAAVRRARPRNRSLGRRSWTRVEPLLHGTRIEIHLDARDDPAAVRARLEAVLDKAMG